MLWQHHLHQHLEALVEEPVLAGEEAPLVEALAAELGNFFVKKVRIKYVSIKIVVYSTIFFVKGV